MMSDNTCNTTDTVAQHACKQQQQQQQQPRMLLITIQKFIHYLCWQQTCVHFPVAVTW